MKIGLECSSMQQADYQCHQPTHSMNARKCVHAQKPYPSQAIAHKASKVRGKKGMKRDRKDRGQEADGKKGSPTKQNITHLRN